MQSKSISLKDGFKASLIFLGFLRFRVGLVTNTAVGPLIDVSAYSFAPQSLVAPFGGLLSKRIFHNFSASNDCNKYVSRNCNNHYCIYFYILYYIIIYISLEIM